MSCFSFSAADVFFLGDGEGGAGKLKGQQWAAGGGIEQPPGSGWRQLLRGPMTSSLRVYAFMEERQEKATVKKTRI